MLNDLVFGASSTASDHIAVAVALEGEGVWLHVSKMALVAHRKELTLANGCPPDIFDSAGAL